MDRCLFFFAIIHMWREQHFVGNNSKVPSKVNSCHLFSSAHLFWDILLVYQCICIYVYAVFWAIELLQVQQQEEPSSHLTVDVKAAPKASEDVQNGANGKPADDSIAANGHTKDTEMTEANDLENNAATVTVDKDSAADEEVADGDKDNLGTEEENEPVVDLPPVTNEAEKKLAEEFKTQVKDRMKQRDDLFDEMVVHEEQIQLGEAGWKSRYYGVSLFYFVCHNQLDLSLTSSNLFVVRPIILLRSTYTTCLWWAWCL